MQWLNNVLGGLRLKAYKWPLFVILFCCFASAILGDNTAESLLLAHCDTRLIASMFLINALFLFLSSSVLMSLIDRVDRGKLFVVLIFGHGLMLVAIKTALLFPMAFLYPFLFSYAYVTKILLFLIFWTLANDLVDSRKASSEFPFIAAGGTLGAICVSFTVPWLLKVTSADNLLLMWSILALAMGVLFILVRASFGASFKATSDKQKHAPRNLKSVINDLKLVKQEPLLWNMAIFYFLLFFTVINQQYAFYAQLKNHLSNVRELASFLGYFNGISMLATFILQISVTGLVLKKIGSTRSMLFLPAMLAIVFVTLSYLGFIPAAAEQNAAYGSAQVLFWSVVIGMGLRMAFFDSFFSPNFQVFFSSLSQDVRGRGKLAIEGVVKPLAIVCASLWLLFVAPKISMGASMAVLFYCAVGMIIQTFRIRKKYTESLARNLTGYKTKQLSKLFNVIDLAKEDNFLTALSRILDKEDFEIKKYIIEILVEMNSKESISILLDYIEHCDEITRATILASLGRLQRESLKEIFMRYLADPDKRVRANCISALGAYDGSDITDALEPFLLDADNRIRANAIVALWLHWTPGDRKKLFTVVLEMFTALKIDSCASALYALGEIKSPEFLPRLEVFMTQNMRILITNNPVWRQFVGALAKIGGERALDMILVLSEYVNRKKTMDLIFALKSVLDNGYALDAFIKRLPKARYVHRSVMLTALYERRQPIDKDYDALIMEMAHKEIRAVYSEWISVNTLDSKAELSGIKLLRMAIIEESIGERLRNVVYAAALLDKSGQVWSAVPRLYHANRHVRARAFELLDNVGDIQIHRSILRLLDTSDAVIHSREGALGLKIRSKSLMEVVAQYQSGHHDWLGQCAGFAAHSLHSATNDPRWQQLIVNKTYN